jgi:asparagine synthase (glutamine-hydrolysing)
VSLRELPPLQAALHVERQVTLPALLHVEDRVLMAHGLEGRPVFCLGDVPDAARALHPDDVIGPDGEGKVALRAILKGRIPESVRMDKRKRGFPTPFGRAARGAGRERVKAILSDRRFRERGWWNVEACRALLDEERPLHDRALFALLSWETWARLFVDGDAFREPVRPSSSPGTPVR